MASLATVWDAHLPAVDKLVLLYVADSGSLDGCAEFAGLTPTEVDEVSVRLDVWIAKLADAEYLASLGSTARELARRDGAICRHCGVKRGLTMDHRVPRSRGGGDEESQLLCGSCNSSKGAR